MAEFLAHCVTENVHQINNIENAKSKKHFSKNALGRVETIVRHMSIYKTHTL